MADKRRDNESDEMRGRDLAGASYGANERDQTRERERVANHPESDQADEFVTDAEMEVREANGETTRKRGEEV